MIRNRFCYVLGAAILLGGFTGCGEDVQQGVPEGLDMSEDYTPPVPLLPMSPKDMQQAPAEAKTQE